MKEVSKSIIDSITEIAQDYYKQLDVRVFASCSPIYFKINDLDKVIPPMGFLVISYDKYKNSKDTKYMVDKHFLGTSTDVGIDRMSSIINDPCACLYGYIVVI